MRGFADGSPRSVKSPRRARSATTASAATTAPSLKRWPTWRMPSAVSRTSAIWHARRWRRASPRAVTRSARPSGATSDFDSPWAAAGSRAVSSDRRCCGSPASRIASPPTSATSHASTTGHRGRAEREGQASSAPPNAASAAGTKTASRHAAAWNASSAGTCRTTRIATPFVTYVQAPTPSPSRSPAVSRSARAPRATKPSSAPAPAQTRTKSSSGTPAVRDSSSSGSASATRGPGHGAYGRTR